MYCFPRPISVAKLFAYLTNVQSRPSAAGRKRHGFGAGVGGTTLSIVTFTVLTLPGARPSLCEREVEQLV